MVGLKEQDLLKYPHEFSGGQRCRGFPLQEHFPYSWNFSLDEPISALDVSWQAQIVQMLQDLQEKPG